MSSRQYQYTLLDRFNDYVLVHLLLILGGVCSIGCVAVLMKCVEERHEAEERTRFEAHIAELQTKLLRRLASAQGRSMADKLPLETTEAGAVLNELMQLAWEKGRHGVPIPQLVDGTAVPAVWTLANSFLFATSLFARIGYGHIVPLSALGKALAAVFALFGAPLFSLLVVDLVNLTHLNTLAQWLAREWNRNCRQRWEDHFMCQLLQRVSLTFGLGLFFAFCALMAALYRTLEGWDWPDCAYFVLISFQSIGFGDIAPSYSFSSGVTTAAIFVGCALYAFASEAILYWYHAKFLEMESRVKQCLYTCKRRCWRSAPAEPENVECAPKQQQSPAASEQESTPADNKMDDYRMQDEPN